ncbi:unnamed protein product [Caenorhabditis bovis]|uniref:Uncharacterized protein n=1 Tax=Caenorhabditis bovis TaxID=2654633 RepID=A0A8S1FEU9_9PELO|nr:unnamed protein product [Caenorhabditis bovis]
MLEGWYELDLVSYETDHWVKKRKRRRITNVWEKLRCCWMRSCANSGFWNMSGCESNDGNIGIGANSIGLVGANGGGVIVSIGIWSIGGGVQTSDEAGDDGADTENEIIGTS